MSATPLSINGNIDAVAGAQRTEFASVAASIVITIGVLVLVGWTTDVESLKGLIPGMIVMLPVTAVTFLLSGTALYLLRNPTASDRNRRIAMSCSAVVLAIGALSFAERIFGFGTPLDTLLFGRQLLQYDYRPVGVMASNSSFSFIFLATSLMLLNCEEHRTTSREVTATVALAVSLLALLGYLFGARPLYAFDRAAGMAFITAVTFLVMSLGVLFARPESGSIALIVGDALPSRLIRRLLLSAVLVPIIAGALYLHARNNHIFTRETGIAALTLVTIGMLVILTLNAGHALHRTHMRRERTLLNAQQSAQEAVAAREEAEAASRIKGEFLATMSHELRTPLNAIMGYTNLMLEGIGGELPPQHVQQLKRIDVSARHLLYLIDQVLTIARTEASREAVDLATVEIAGLVNEAAAMMQPLFDSKQSVVFTIDVKTGDATIQTDAAKVRQILLNLVSNAAKFTDKGSVTLAVSKEESSDWYRFDVSDTGIGIAPEHQSRVFDAFWQADMNTTRRHGGAGLGLSVSRDLAILLGGEILLKSTPGVGSTFTLRLPG